MRSGIGEYPSDWPEIAARIKADAGGQCVRCKHVHDPAGGYTLTVHHLDMNRENCRWWNCPALCQRCHLQIQAKVIMERRWLFEHSDWFKPYLAGAIAFQMGLPDSRGYVAVHLHALLSGGY